jgi:hypothetical protein
LPVPRLLGGPAKCRRTGARTIGSLAFTIAARVVFTIVDNPSVAGSRFLLPAKMDLQAPSECKGRSFTIHNHEIHWDVDPINLRPDELKALAASGVATCDRLSQTAIWLRELLTKDDPPASTAPPPPPAPTTPPT